MYQIWPRGTLMVKTLSDAITLHVLSAQYLIPGRENATSKSITTKLILNKSVDLFYNSVTRSFARRAIVVQTEKLHRDPELRVQLGIKIHGSYLGWEISQNGWYLSLVHSDISQSG